MKQDDDKPNPRISLIDTWRPPGGLSEDPYNQKTAQRRVPADILAAARRGIYGAGVHGDAGNPAAEDSAAEDSAAEQESQLRDEALEALDSGWDGES